VIGFFHPLAWAWAGLAALIALFYLWHFTRRRQEVATFWLWQRALARRPAWFVLRFWASLVAQIVILVLLVAAIAEPYWKQAVAARRNVVLILDVSASMSATDVEPSRWEQMRQEAARLAGSLQAGEQMAILAVGSSIQVACRFTDRREQLLAALDALVATDGITRVPEAVDLARRLVQDKKNPHIFVLTDGGFPAAAQLAAAEDVQLKLIRGSAANLAITRLAARAKAAGPEEYEILVETANFGDQSVELPLETGLEDEPPLRTSLSLGGGEVVPRVISLPVDRSALVSARLAVEDALSADDRAFVLVQAHRRPTVILIAGAAPDATATSLQAAVQAVPNVDLQVVAQLPAALPEDAVVVVHGAIPDPLPACPLLVVEPENDCELWKIAGTLPKDSSAVKDTDRGSPLLQGVRLEDVVVEGAIRLEFSQPAVSLAESVSGDPLYSLLDRPEGKVLVLHVQLATEKSDLTLRPDFPRLIGNAIRWLAPRRDLVGTSVTTGPGVQLPAADVPRQLTAPDDTRRTLSPEPSIVTLDRAGVWTVSAGQGEAGGAAEFVLPSNLVDRNESDLRIGGDVVSRGIEVAAASDQRPLWMLLVGTAVLLIVAEWCLYHCRVVV
jgi:hypothetical protein